MVRNHTAMGGGDVHVKSIGISIGGIYWDFEYNSALQIQVGEVQESVTEAIPVSAETEQQAMDVIENVPANPVHYCAKQEDGIDITDWSYIYFGSYPQSEVTGDALTLENTEDSYDENGDAWVDGRKYRRISKKDVLHDYYCLYNGVKTLAFRRNL